MTAETRVCGCGTPVDDLPLFFVERRRTVHLGGGYYDDEYEDHMFHACDSCGQSFCSCQQPHRLKRGVPS